MSTKTDELMRESITREVKELLLDELAAQKVTRAELARRMGVRPQTVTRIVNVHEYTKIDTLEAAIKALGRTLTIDVKPLPEPPEDS